MKFVYPPHLKEYVAEIISAPIIDSNSKNVGWTTAVIDVNGDSLGSGTAVSKEDSKRIAVAESLEVLILRFGVTDEIRASLCIAEFPTRCGIAVGFSEASTKRRSHGEAFERWIWSKWIDQGYTVPIVDLPRLSKLASHYCKQFDAVHFFQKRFRDGALGIKQPLIFAAVIAVKDGGAYPGSRVCAENEDPWEHSITEAWRHKKITEQLPFRVDIYDVLRERLQYFSCHSSEALNQASLGQNNSWPKPLLRTESRITNFEQFGIFLYRTICHDYVPWHLGSAERFVF